MDPWLFHTESEPFTDGKFLELYPQSAVWLNSKDFGYWGVGALKIFGECLWTLSGFPVGQFQI